MDTIEKVYCTGHDNNDALVAALASKNNCDPMAIQEFSFADGRQTLQERRKIQIWKIQIIFNCGVLDVVFDDTTVQ